MSAFAHTETGFAVNVIVADDEAAYAARFNPDSMTSQVFADGVWSNVPWKIVHVPDGTIDGAKDNGDGTFSAPPSPSIPIPQPVALTKTAFEAFYASNGNNLTTTLDNWPTG